MNKFLTLEHVEKICYEFAKAHLTYDEPIPSFSSRFPNKLESALAIPAKSYNNKSLYPTLERQAAVLFYEMIKLHPFLNGNKRIATVSLTTFLLLNRKWLSTDWQELYQISVTVAASAAENRTGILRLLEEFIRNKVKKS